jgi:hypothetical protein
MNRSIYDYLCALRTNPKFVFEVNEIIYVLRNVSKSCIALKSNFQDIQEWGLPSQIYHLRKFFYHQREKLFYVLCFILQNH